MTPSPLLTKIADSRGFHEAPGLSAGDVRVRWSALLRARPALIQNIPNRTTISLDGPWQAIVDPYETGLNARFFLNARAKDKHELVEYDFDKSDTLNVPGDWNSQKKDLFFYEGPVWYKKSFSYHKRERTRVFVHFGAANYFTRVYLNGQALGEHEGGFTPFNFEITDQIREGDNFLVAEVNNARRRDAVPSVSTDWWNYGGITRDVALVEVPASFIQDYVVQLAKGSSNEIAGWVQLGGSTSAQQVTIEIAEAGIKQTFATDATGRAEFRFHAKLELWSPGHPKLYDVAVVERLRQGPRFHRFPDHRDSRHPNIAQRPAHLPARHLDA